MRWLPVVIFASEATASFSVAIKKLRRPTPEVSIIKRDTLNLTAFRLEDSIHYYAEIQIGTPLQNMLMLLDTGSGNTWVTSADSDLCSSSGSANINCIEYYFRPSASSTFKLMDLDGFNVTYGDGRNLPGGLFTDIVVIDGQEISNQSLGLPDEPDSSFQGSGLLGLGRRAFSASGESYPTILDNMVTAGRIERAAFSLYLNDENSESGTVLFGGIDTDKFVGQLSTIPLISEFPPDLQLEVLVPPSGILPQYFVMLSGIQVANSDVFDTDVTCLLDSGAPLSYLPEEDADKLWEAVPVEIYQAQFAFVDCSYKYSAAQGQSVNFQFGSTTIQVPLHSLIVDSLGDQESLFRGLLGVSFDRLCLFGVQSISIQQSLPRQLAILGSPVLRSAYVVYDSANNQLGIAQANLNSTESNIVELAANETVFPDVRGVNPPSTPGPTTESPAPTATDSDDDKDSAGIRVTPPLGLEKMGVAVVSSVFILIGGLIVLV